LCRICGETIFIAADAHPISRYAATAASLVPAKA
jgi:hypothetical protein